MQSKASTSPSQPKSPTPKSTPKLSRKSFRLASQSTPRTSKPAGPSEQQPTLIEEIVSSPESSPVREKGKAPAEQGSPQVSHVQTPATDKGKGPAKQSLKPTYQPQKHIPRGHHQKGRFLQSRSPTRALLRINL